MAGAERSFGSSARPSPLKHIIKPSCERCPPSTWRNGTSFSLKTKGPVLAKFLPVYYTYLICLNLPYSSRSVHSSSNLTLNIQIQLFLWIFISLRKFLCCPYLNKFVYFSPVNLFLSLIFKPTTGPCGIWSLFVPSRLLN